MNLGKYLFSESLNGPYYDWIMVLAIAILLLGIAASVAIRRSGFIVVRRRARSVASLCYWTAALLGTYLLARELALGFLAWRIWLYLILAVFAVRLLLWSLQLSSLSHDKVVERQARQKQAYFRKRGATKRPAKRRRK